MMSPTCTSHPDDFSPNKTFEKDNLIHILKILEKNIILPTGVKMTPETQNQLSIWKLKMLCARIGCCPTSTYPSRVLLTHILCWYTESKQ